MLPIGALAGGFLGEKMGIANTLWIGAAGVLLSTLFPRSYHAFEVAPMSCETSNSEMWGGLSAGSRPPGGSCF
jgi:hypothetical protein